LLLTLDGRRIDYDLIGTSGAPVVCFAHSLAADSGMWAEQIPALLGGGFAVLRIDMRGHGGSDAVPGDYTFEGLAGDLAAVLDALGIGRVHLVGLSVGAMIGQVFAPANPDRLHSLVLCDTQSAAGEGARAAWSMPLAMVRQRNSVAPVANGMLKAWLSDDYKAAHAGRYEQIRQTMLATSPVGFAGCVAAMSTYDHTPILPTTATRTLVVCGADDPMTKPTEARKVAELIPGARYEELAGARHLSNVEQADVFNRLLLDWLRS
jgi:3-oxoadipate enol-lactonase